MIREIRADRPMLSIARLLKLSWGFLLVLFLTLVSQSAFAVGLLTVTTANLGANQVTLQITSPNAGKASLTLLQGSATCGTAAQTAAGTDSTGTAAFRIGSLTLVSATTGSYTVRNLMQSTAYTACIADAAS